MGRQSRPGIPRRHRKPRYPRRPCPRRHRARPSACATPTPAASTPTPASTPAPARRPAAHLRPHRRREHHHRALLRQSPFSSHYLNNLKLTNTYTGRDGTNNPSHTQHDAHKQVRGHQSARHRPEQSLRVPRVPKHRISASRHLPVADLDRRGHRRAVADFCGDEEGARRPSAEPSSWRCTR